MPRHINSASRIYSLLSLAVGNAENTTTATVWKIVFGINSTNENRSAIEISEKLGLMYRELDIISTEMKKANFSENLYLPAIAKAENAISPQLLYAPWSNAKHQITQDMLISFSYCSEIMPDEEAQISAEDIELIEKIINELITSLEAASLPERLVTLIRHHVALIQEALSNYSIQGAKALKSVSSRAIGELIEAQEEISKVQDNPAIGKLGKLWKTVNSVADAAIKAEKIAKLCYKGYEFLEKFT